MIKQALLTSNSDDWATPPDFFDRLNEIFNFQLDAAASSHNAKCEKYFDQSMDSLSQDWYAFKRIWLNPPYGRGMENWLQKAYQEAAKGCVVVALVPARTDTNWWHNWVHGKADVTFIRRRLKFRNPERCPDGKGNSVFPSALLIYGLDFDAILNCKDNLHIGRSHISERAHVDECQRLGKKQ